MEAPAADAQSGPMLFPMLTLLLATNPVPNAEFHFTTPDHEIAMSVDFPAAWHGTPARFYEPGSTKSRCLTEQCMNQMYGAAAIVNFLVSPRGEKSPRAATLREVVTVLRQSPDLPVTPPLDLTIRIVKGRAGDVQLLGYDEALIPADLRDQMREQAPARMWRDVRQELYLNGATVPFAVIYWRHTLETIRIERIEASPI